MIDGIALIDKPRGITSHDLVDRVREIIGQKRVGHAGILDPLATGLMVMLLGKGTLLSPQLTGADKRYRATFLFGKATDTFDGEGKIVSICDPGHLSREQFQQICEEFKGKIEQLVPPFSAAKVNGRKMYEAARRGKEVEERRKEVEIMSIDIVDFQWPRVTLDIHCSGGTYVRSLAHEMGQKLGFGAHLESLVRTGVGPFSLAEALSLEEFARRVAANDSPVRPLLDALPDKPRISVRPEYVQSILDGRPFIKRYLLHTQYRGPGGCLSVLLDPNNKILALVQLNYSWGSFDRLDGRDVLGKYIRIVDEGHLRQERT